MKNEMQQAGQVICETGVEMKYWRSVSPVKALPPRWEKQALPPTAVHLSGAKDVMRHIIAARQAGIGKPGHDNKEGQQQRQY